MSAPCSYRMDRLGLTVYRSASPVPKARIGHVGTTGATLAAGIAAQYGLTLRQIQSPARGRWVAWPRQHVMSALRDAGYSEPGIGRFLNRDASTVSTGDRRHRERAAWADVVIVLGGGPEFQPDLFARAA